MTRDDRDVIDRLPKGFRAAFSIEGYGPVLQVEGVIKTRQEAESVIIFLGVMRDWLLDETTSADPA